MSNQNKPIRSMTGFARVRKTTDNGELAVSVKSLNHRTLDVRLWGSQETEPCEVALRQLIARHVARGHLEVRVSLPPAASAMNSTLNMDQLRGYTDAIRAAASELRLAADPDLNVLVRLPGVIGSAGEASAQSLAPQVEETLLEAMRQALAELNACREREAAHLVVEIRTRCESIRKTALKIESLRERVVPFLKKRLSERMGELLSGAGVDPQRLAQEAAFLAERSDISEELDRLKVHAGQLTEILDQGGEVGKRLDFLLQEMQREANTILSKAGGAGELGLRITDLALAAKANIEKIREQALNLE